MMKSVKGYQIFEPELLNELVTNTFQHAFAVAILNWLCVLVRLELKEHLQHIEVEVIVVTYMGSYPAIGIHYKTDGYQDMKPIIEKLCDRFLKERSALELAQFISSGNINWEQEAAELMKPIKIKEGT